MLTETDVEGMKRWRRRDSEDAVVKGEGGEECEEVLWGLEGC